MNQGKLEVVKQEMARVNVDILGISELEWTGMGEFNSDDHYIYYYSQESLRINGVAIMVNKRVRNTVLYSYSYSILVPWLFVIFLIVTKSISSVSLRYFLTLFLPLTPYNMQAYIIDTMCTFINTPVTDFNQLLSPLWQVLYLT